jgi:hypothetical protein
MTSRGRGFEFNAARFHFRAYRGDVEVRLGVRMLTALWGCGSLGGVFLQGRRGERHWTWAEVWAAFTRGREGAAAT